MTKVERIFWSEQLKALSCQRKNSRCMRWNPFIIKVALNIRMITSTEGYKYLKFFVKLPSNRLLYDYTHAVQAKDGIQDETVRNLVEQTQGYKEEHLKYFNIEFDEMHVRSDIVIDKKTGDIIGYAHLRKVEKDLADMEAEISSSNFSPSLAKTVLVFLVQGVSNPLLGVVVGIYPSKDLSSSQLFSRVWDVIYTMESCGLKVSSIICDGAAMNKKFSRIHPGVDALQVGSDYVYATKNLAATEERLLYFMVDPPHLLKTVRNCLTNSYCHKKSRKMWKNNEDLSWVTIEKLYAISAQDKYPPHKLTRAHIKLTPFSCMKVILATQTMSGSVARELKNLKDHEALAVNFHISHHLLMVLWILATPDTFRSVALRFGVYPSGVHDAYKYILLALVEMGEQYVTWPNQEERNVIKRRLQRVSDFPGIVGIMDGSHIPITAPHEEKAAYRNYHHGYSVKLQVVCDDRLLVRDMYVGEAGSLHDARVFRRSPVCRRLLENPNMIQANEHIIADSAYTVLDKVLVPFTNNGHLTPEQRNYNRRLSRVRAKVEHTFGRVTGLWRRLRVEYAVEHIAASVVMHNFRILNGQPFGINYQANPYEDDEEDEDNIIADEELRGGWHDILPDPHVPQGNLARELEDCHTSGEQKRWDLTHQLPL
ncbi:Putative nuclease [Frankliniella fusca]|uniref:Nuclease n=1 Tax=Frankliniella fusca TaxID=407009 RepID=A0AAE1H7J9_9NEOP|nr:Putative nuclease [Frankliniella fusca]